MLVIRTAEDMDSALSAPLATTVKDRLAAQREYLLDYPDHAFEELGVFVVVQPGDRMIDLNQVTAFRLVERDRFTIEAELVERYGNFLEVLFVLSDDGFGLILYVPLQPDTDPVIVQACQTLVPHLTLTTAF